MKKILIVLIAIFSVMVIICLFFCVIKLFNAEKGYKNYLEFAASSPTIERSYEFLEKALSYIEKEGLTEGNTAIIIKTPADDIEIWYEQIKGSRDVLFNIINKDGISQLEKDNALIRVKEVLLNDSGSLIKPSLIELNPFFWWYLLILFAMIFILIILIVVYHEEY